MQWIITDLADYLNQLFLTFFALLAPKIQNNFHGPLKCYNVLLVDPLPLNSCKRGVHGYITLLF